MVDATRLCDELGIPHHIVDSREVFQREIVDYLVSGYGQGVTPLPCSQCNRAVEIWANAAVCAGGVGVRSHRHGPLRPHLPKTPKPGATNSAAP